MQTTARDCLLVICLSERTSSVRRDVIVPIIEDVTILGVIEVVEKGLEFFVGWGFGAAMEFIGLPCQRGHAIITHLRQNFYAPIIPKRDAVFLTTGCKQRTMAQSFNINNRMSPMEQYDAAIALRQSGDDTLAKEALRKLATDAPDFPLTYNAIAAIEKKNRNLDSAIQNMQKYCELEPDDAFGFAVLSAFCIAAGKHAEAEDALGKASDLRFRSQFG